jgi:hypothetical protein
LRQRIPRRNKRAVMMLPLQRECAERLATEKGSGAVAKFFRQGRQCPACLILTAFHDSPATSSAAEPRSCEALWQSTGHIVQGFTATKCANFLTNAGYGQPR